MRSSVASANTAWRAWSDMFPTLALLTAALLLSAASVSASAEIPVVGIVYMGSPEPCVPYLKQYLKDRGHQEGRSFVVECRWAGGDYSRFPAIARELLSRRPAVIVAPCGTALRAIRELSRTVPVVAGCADPKNFLGEVASLSRPGGQTTGLTFLAPESAAKRQQLLKELVPRLSHVGILHYRHEDWGTYLEEMERAGPQLGLTFSKLPVERAEDLEGAFATAVRQRAGALVAFPDSIAFGARTRIAALAITHKLPTAFDTRIFVVDGGLLSYGPDWFDPDFMRRITKTYVEKILSGAAPGDLPIQQPTRLELVVNLRTARMLGLNVPQSFLSRADEVLK